MRQCEPFPPFSLELLIESGPLSGQRVSLSSTRPMLILGRGDEADLDFTDQGGMARVGRQHAQIELREGGAYLRDLNSRNRTALNRVVIAPHEACRLRAGDLIQLAPVDGPRLRVASLVTNETMAPPSDSAALPLAPPVVAPRQETSVAEISIESAPAEHEVTSIILADLSAHLETLSALLNDSTSGTRPTLQKIKTRLAELKQTLGRS